MSKFSCKRCGESINVCTNEREYINDGGVLYCGELCYKNKHIHIDLSRKRPKKHKKFSKGTLVIIKSYDEYDEARSKYGYGDMYGKVFIVFESSLRNSSYWLRDFKGYIIKDVKVGLGVELTRPQLAVIEKLKLGVL